MFTDSRRRLDALEARLEARCGQIEQQLRDALGALQKLDPVQLELLRDQALNAIRGIRRREKLQDAPETPNATPPATLPLPTLAEARRRLPGGLR